MKVKKAINGYKKNGEPYIVGIIRSKELLPLIDKNVKVEVI